jgi:hypothetical protein
MRHRAAYHPTANAMTAVSVAASLVTS